jgi:class 3 adenylate cyclase
MTTDLALLDARLAALEGARAWSPRLLAKFEALLTGADEAQLVRMNPLAFAREKGVATAEALDLFLHAAKLGLVMMEWHLLCPRCGAAVESFASLRTVHRNFFCALCALRSEANLDDYIQVSFTVAPAVRKIRFHAPAALSAEDFVYRLRFTREMHIGSLDGPRMCDLLPQMLGVVTWVAPGERRAFGFDAATPGMFSVSEFQAHTGQICQVVADAPAGPLEIEIGETAMTLAPAVVRPGRITGHVTNHRAHPVVFATSFHSADDLAMAELHGVPTALEPIVTGAMLLTNQTFRRLFRSETIGSSEGLTVREVTVLFTDLKSSTALYQRIGDLKAFSLVQQHFDRLGAVVQAHQGAIVKTIGDAIMAAFQRPTDAVQAALEMQAQIELFNHEHGGRDVVLKIGIHRGPSIAVTLNDSLDYFGHTVNVAARVQGLADADEIFVTDEVYQSAGVAALLAQVEAQDVHLRGVQGVVRVHKSTR